MKKNWCLLMLGTFDYHSLTGFFESLAPSFRYAITKPLLLVSFAYPTFVAVVGLFFPGMDAAIGVQDGAFISLILGFVVELMTGITASHLRKEQFSSLKLSRFTLKIFVYLVIIAIPYQWKNDFKAHHNDVMAAAFDWLQNFLIAQIVFENIVSILENMAVICGNDKAAWINKIKEKLNLLK
jgi:hypothetical protein